MEKIAKFKSKLAIDEHALEIALREHPELVYDVGMELALAISNRDEAKQTLEETEADADAKIRRDASIADEKVTEKEVESLKKRDKTVKSATDAYLAAKLNAAQWTVLKEAFEQRSYALSKLVELYQANYYSDKREVKTAGDYRGARAEHVKETNAAKRVRV